jgi:hypothetical protein
VRHSISATAGVRGPRFSATQRFLLGAAGFACSALCLLVVGQFETHEVLDAASLFALGTGLLLSYLAVLTWSVPVLGSRHVFAVAVAWGAGIAAACRLVFLANERAHSLLWVRSVQWLALTLSLVVGALFLRVLLRRRTSHVIVRVLSLVSPVAILVLIALWGAHP